MTGRRRAAPKHAPSNPAPALWRPMAMAAAALERMNDQRMCVQTSVCSESLCASAVAWRLCPLT